MAKRTKTSMSPDKLLSGLPPDQIIGELGLQCRNRKQILRARTRLSNQVDAQERLATGQLKAGKAAKNKYVVSPLAREAASQVVPVLATHLKALQDAQKPYDKLISQLAEQLPVWPWVQNVKGCGALMLGLIIGETGDLSLYANPAKVWKRMGLAVMPDGGRQRRVTGDAAIEHGYNPERRSLMYVLGDCLIKLNGEGKYRTLYDERKALEQARNESGENAKRAADLLKSSRDASAASKKAWKDGKLTPGHIANRASRYVQKRFLVHLWEEWNKARQSVAA